MTTIAFLGLGNMGGPMAANLVSAGHTVNGFDPVPALKEAAQANGANVFDSGASAAAEADVVITSLPNGAIVKAAYAEILPVAKDGALLIDTSTISVDDARDIHAQAAERGLAQLDAPVSGGIKGAAGTVCTPPPPSVWRGARRDRQPRLSTSVVHSPSRSSRWRRNPQAR